MADASGSSQVHLIEDEGKPEKGHRGLETKGQSDRLLPGKTQSSHQDKMIRSYGPICKIIGIEGGTMHLAGYSLCVPQRALPSERKISMKMAIVKREQTYVEGEWMLFGPELDFGPDGTAFSKPVTVAVPTCYSPSKNNEGEVMIQTAKRPGHWEEHQRAVLGQQPDFEFTVLHFSLYRFLMRVIGARKSVAHTTFSRLNNGNEYEFIWCFYDNLKETKLEIEKEMRLQEFHLTKSTETLSMGCDDDFRVSLRATGAENGDLMERTITADSLWYSGSIVKEPFTVNNLVEGDAIEYKIKSLNRANDDPIVKEYKFRPSAGHMEAEGGTHFHNARIGVLDMSS